MSEDETLEIGERVEFTTASGHNKVGILQSIGRLGRYARVDVYENEFLTSMPVNYHVAVVDLRPTPRNP